MMGSRSCSPEIDNAFFTRSAGRSRPKTGHRQASIIAARWPPAEWPATVMRRGSPPWRAMLRQVQASACTICIVICGTVTAGHSA